MNFEFEHLGTPTPFELSEGEHLLGGGEDDQIRLEGLPPGLLTLRIGEGRLMVEARHSFTVEGVLVPPGVPRLVLPGEVVGLSEDMSLRVRGPERETERQVGTMAVLKHLLVDLDAPLVSRAATLQCLTGAEVGRTFALAEAVTELGRGQAASVRLRDRAVSRSHARIRHEEGTFFLEDQDSPNGVFLNGQRVDAPRALQEGDVIELGRTLLRFQAPVAEPPPPAPEPPPGEPPAPVAPESTAPERRQGRWEPWLLGLGALLALVGLLSTWALAT
ncbi:FHA domain-containing protein [Melittangium boletus]|uniref:Phosphopeptide-binding protein n=1 Tax=Melittangium boletus DSM 14713 TaxID=1294270 RepID=A0A250I7N5_9BACT|nr:FHA domain-containing protein [Melittangium boletus]ATB27193.1 phosphopeptide-binding protein [Melittangium boletus DSM 14713]